MQTKDPALTKTPIVDGKDKPDHLHIGGHHRVTPEIVHDDPHHKGTETLQETVIGTLYTSDQIFDDVIHEHDGHLHGQYHSAVPHDESIHHGDHRVQRALDEHKNTSTFQETVVGSGYMADAHTSQHGVTDTNIHKDTNNLDSTFLATDHVTTNQSGNDILHESTVRSEHVNTGDEPARNPDRRDQEGSAFDEGINEHSVRSEPPKSESINDMNRYASIDNAQNRTLNPDEK
jgi:hypothetical protein